MLPALCKFLGQFWYIARFENWVYRLETPLDEKTGDVQEEQSKPEVKEKLKQHTPGCFLKGERLRMDPRTGPVLS